MYGSGAETTIIKQIGTDSVQRQSIKTLRLDEWLNDEFIHYFYVMLSKRDDELCKQDNSRRKSQFFKSFFKTKLLDEGNKTLLRVGLNLSFLLETRKHMKKQDLACQLIASST
jgi:hypothetical protein